MHGATEKELVKSRLSYHKSNAVKGDIVSASLLARAYEYGDEFDYNKTTLPLAGVAKIMKKLSNIII